jgi:hypothetical protein
MAGTLFSWVFRPNRTSPTTAQPSQRRLWCAFSNDIDRVFSIYCTLNVDTIDDVKKKIWMDNQRMVGQLDFRELDLYSPVSPVKDSLTKENLVYLHPRKWISSDFPQSNDPDIDIVIIRPPGQHQFTAAQGMILHLESLYHSHTT